MCSETLLIFLVCKFLCLIILLHFILLICAVFALSLKNMQKCIAKQS